MIVVQQERAQEIDDEAEHGDRDRFPEGDGDGMDQAGDRFIGDQQRHHPVQDAPRRGVRAEERAEDHERSRPLAWASRTVKLPRLHG